MPNFTETPFQLNKGVDLYNPDVTASELNFVRLKNIQPKFGRWVTPDGLKIKEQLPSSTSFIFVTEDLTKSFESQNGLGLISTE